MVWAWQSRPAVPPPRRRDQDFPGRFRKLNRNEIPLYSFLPIPDASHQCNSALQTVPSERRTRARSPSLGRKKAGLFRFQPCIDLPPQAVTIGQDFIFLVPVVPLVCGDLDKATVFDIFEALATRNACCGN